MSAGNDREFIDFQQGKQKGGRSMKCPLREVPKFDEEGEAHFEQADCLKKECAWWESPDLGCAFLLISLRLGTICEVLTELVKKMPHEEQFRK